jgi:hypothetical protein|tara:strand:+ start:5015 stop:5614 length:600 start_codon:yes stop_codon:yes gene_type:complete
MAIFIKVFIGDFYKMGAPKNNRNAVGNHGGAPTIYKQEYAKQLIDFFSISPSKRELAAKMQGKNFEKEEYKEVPNDLPTLTRFAVKIGTSTQTLHNWCNMGQEKVDEELPLNEQNSKSPLFFEFFEAFTRAKELYRDFLIQNGLKGLYPPAFAIFVATNTAGMKDKKETGLTAGEGGILPAVVLMPQRPKELKQGNENE